jgi:hypothetical protein
MHTKFRSENLTGRGHLGDLSADGRIKLTWNLQKIGWEIVDGIHVAQNREGCFEPQTSQERALLYGVISYTIM